MSDTHTALSTAYSTAYCLDVPDIAGPKPPSTSSLLAGLTAAQDQQEINVQQELWKARAAAAEQEVEALHLNLARERSHNATLRQQLEKSAIATTSSTPAPFSASPPEAAPALSARNASNPPHLSSREFRRGSVESVGSRPSLSPHGRSDAAAVEELSDTHSDAAHVHVSGIRPPDIQQERMDFLSRYDSEIHVPVLAAHGHGGNTEMLMGSSGHIDVNRLVQQMNEMRRHAKSEITQLKSQFAKKGKCTCFSISCRFH